MSIFQAVYDNTPLFWANLVDVSLQDVMSQLQHLLSVQFSFLPAEPECHESMATPGEKKQNKNPNYSFFSFSYILVFLQQRVPGVTEEPVILAFLSPHQPLPERGVVEHPAAIISPQQKRRQLLQAVHKLCPGKRSSGQSACIYDLKQLVEEISERGDMVDEVQLQYITSRRVDKDWNRSSGSCLSVCPFLFVLNSTIALMHSLIFLNFNCSLHCRLNDAARKRKRLSFPKSHPARNIVVISLVSVTYIPTGTHTRVMACLPVGLSVGAGTPQ